MSDGSPKPITLTSQPIDRRIKEILQKFEEGNASLNTSTETSVNLVDETKVTSQSPSNLQIGSSEKRKRRTFTQNQLMLLRQFFEENSVLNPGRTNLISNSLNVEPERVHIWFKNERFKKRREADKIAEVPFASSSATRQRPTSPNKESPEHNQGRSQKGCQ